MKTEQQHGVDERTSEMVEENCAVTGVGQEEIDGQQKKIYELEAQRTRREDVHQESIKEHEVKLKVETNEQLQAQLKEMETVHQNTLKEHEVKLNRQVETNEQLQAQLKDQAGLHEGIIEKHIEHETTLGIQLATHIENNERLQAQLHEKTKKLEETGRELAIFEDTIRKNNAQMLAQSSTVETLKRQNAEIQFNLQEVRQKHEALKKQTEALRDKNNGLEKEIKKKEKAAQESQNKLQSESWKLEKLDKIHKEFKTKCNDASKKQDMVMEGLRKDAKELQRQAKQDADNCQKITKAHHDTLDRKKDLEEYVKGITQLHTEMTQLKMDDVLRNEKLQALLTEKKAILEENQRLSNSLSKEWSTKVSSDETNTENISVSNRPMMIKTEFENICSDEWLEAKTELDDRQELEDDGRIMFLCEILMKAEKCARMHYEDKMASLKLYLSQPLTHAVVPVSGRNDGSGSNTALDKPESDSSQSSDTSLPLLKASPKEHNPAASLPLELKNAVGDFLRTNADNIDITQLTQDLNNQLITQMEKGSPWIDNVLKNKVIRKYISVCCLLAWKMITQRPPMTFCNDGAYKKYNEKTQEPNFGSDDPNHKQSLVMYFVTPALYHSDGLMVKGRVMTKILK